MVQTLRGRWVGTEYVLEEEPMTEQGWLTSTDPAAMLTSVNHGHGPEISDRKLRLYACALVRQMWGQINQRQREAIEVAERIEIGAGFSHFDTVGSWVCLRTTDGMFDHQWWERTIGTGNPCPPGYADILREVVGNPYSPHVVLPRDLDTVLKRGASNYEQRNVLLSDWLTPTVLMLAGRAYEERVGRKCEKCCGTGAQTCSKCSGEGCSVYGIAANGPCTAGDPCRDCQGTGRIEDGSLDNVTLAALADALEEAGCPPTVLCHRQCYDATISGNTMRVWHDEWGNVFECECKGGVAPHPILAHLRSPGPHVRGCHVVDLILNKE